MSKIYCLTIYNEHYDQFKKLNLIPVGLGNKKYLKKWLTDRTKKNIKHKNKYYGEYTFHYWLWKILLNNLKNCKWIGFCTYRRFWVKKNVKKIKNFIDLKKKIQLDFSSIDKKYEVILTKPIILWRTKLSKIIKHYGFINLIKNPSILFKKKYSIYDHFSIFHGEYFLKESMKFLNVKERKDFKNFLSTSYFNAHNMFMVKNVKILKKFYNKIFPWLFKCEKKFNVKKLKGYEVRKLGFLAELYLNFYFKTNYKTFECNYIFFDTNKILKN